jgi:DNA helicase-2/ATP-dependent DNA helicase PcrA
MVVRHAGWLIRHNRDRISKDIRPRRDAQPGKLEVAGYPSLLEQARHAASWLAEHKKRNNLNWRDYAVLYRYNASQFPVAVMLDALGIPHSPVDTGSLFQSAVGIDVQSYLQVILFPKEARAPDFERILKRPNKFLTNQLIAQARDWTSFLALAQMTSLREWERKRLVELVGLISRFSEMARLGQMTAADFLQKLKADFGLAEFYREQSRLTDDLDQASDDGLLEVIIALAGRYKTPLELYQFLSKSIGDRQGSSEKEASNEPPERESPNSNEVYLSTIHRAKGKEFRNVVYFNLSPTAGDPSAANSQRAFFIEEERRVAYVGATRPKDDLLITFTSTRPSDFLREIALNPKYGEVDEEDLKRGLTSASLRLERAKVFLKQLEAKRQNQIAFFRQLTKTQPGRRPAWIQWLINRIQLWRLDRARARVERTELQIKTHRQETITALEREIQAIEEEGRMRAALGIKR